ncbi:MAG: hypothetical protein HRU07_04575 [Nitrosopumilus sp.]|nr:hypothetical protein [Nitrosopumilus sp.]NRA05427.1 hypothetical protein [Nitrosopumilus sp.]
MNTNSLPLIALVIEGLAFIWQKGVQKHPMNCTCDTCVTIEVSIPVTLAITMSTRK